MEPADSEERLAPDWFLAALVRLANESDMELGVTLSTGGVLVSGVLVSGRRYFAHMREAFRTFTISEEPSGSEAAEAIFRQAGAEDSAPPLRHLHLRGARFFAPGQVAIPAEPGMWWRGRLDAVDGWGLGLFAEGSPTLPLPRP